MGTKSTTKQTKQETQTNAPPEWTLPGLQQTSQKVIEALGSLPGTKYTGDFVATPDKSLVDQIMASYGNTANLASGASQQMMNAAAGLGSYKMDFGGSQTANGVPILPGANLNPFLPTLPTAASAVDPTILDRPDFKSFMPDYGALPNFTAASPYVRAEMLAQPDLQAMKPTLAAAPTLRNMDPTAWAGGTNGEARLQAALEAGIQPVMRQLMEQVLPSIRSSAIDAGAYTGDRAMGILPTQAIAEASTRANEISQGLAYEGFQQEQNRDLQAWQAFEQLMQQSALQENNFNTNIWDKTNQANISLFDILSGAASTNYGIAQNARLQSAANENDFNLGSAQMQNQFGLDRWGLNASTLNDAMRTLVGAESSAYGTQQGALLDRAGMLNDYATANRGMDINALLSIFGTQADNANQTLDRQQSTMLDNARIQNQGYDLQTARGQAEMDNYLRQLGLKSDFLNQGLAFSGGQGDLLTMAMNTLMGYDQAGIDNALARDTYELQYPFRGLDIASQLLATLSGNYGTQSMTGSSTTTQSTGGLGSIVQGIAGLAGMAASLGAFGPLGAASTAVPSAAGLFQPKKAA